LQEARGGLLTGGEGKSRRPKTIEHERAVAKP
jgi:hypothetical protein